MVCYYHPNVQAVGLCKNCHKGLCQECAIDVGNGLACKDNCETAVKEINDIFQRTKTQYYRLGSSYMRSVLILGVFGIAFCLIGLLLMYSNPRSWLAALPLLVISVFAIAGAINSYKESKKHTNPS